MGEYNGVSDEDITGKGFGIKRVLAGKTIESAEEDGGELVFMLWDGECKDEVRIGINAQYCDHAWLTVEIYDGQDLVWRRELWTKR